ncbi:hypothetical protein EDC04DRAFT_2600255 [Pisolithus marmoratus]|nr:hypothetical protein EDC04DRAFT_2600255 [Pisolithus marmoratus]
MPDPFPDAGSHVLLPSSTGMKVERNDILCSTSKGSCTEVIDMVLCTMQMTSLQGINICLVKLPCSLHMLPGIGGERKPKCMYGVVIGPLPNQYKSLKAFLPLNDPVEHECEEVKTPESSVYWDAGETREATETHEYIGLTGSYEADSSDDGDLTISLATTISNVSSLGIGGNTASSTSSCTPDMHTVSNLEAQLYYDNDLGWRVVEVMDTHKVCFTAIDTIHFKTVNNNKEDTDDDDKVLEAKKLVVGPVTIWIGVFPELTSATDVQIEGQELMDKAEETRKALQSLLDQVEKHWDKLNNCVIGHVLCSSALSVLVSNSGWESYDILLDIMTNGAAHATVKDHPLWSIEERKRLGHLLWSLTDPTILLVLLSGTGCNFQWHAHLLTDMMQLMYDEVLKFWAPDDIEFSAQRALGGVLTGPFHLSHFGCPAFLCRLNP